MENFGEGFFDGTGSTTTAIVTMAVGTNNSLTVGTAAGTEWASIIDDINGWLSTHGPTSFRYSEQAVAVGGNDIESSFCLNGTCPDDARSWATAYSSHTSQEFFNYGDCAGCAPFGSPNGSWTYADYYYVSWGAGNAWPLPEIYRTDGGNAAQWERLKEWGHVNRSQDMFFVGSLTESQACGQTGGCSGIDDGPNAGWRHLWKALNTQADYDGHNAPAYCAQSLAWSTDIKYLPY
jgi:hypothetical protein